MRGFLTLISYTIGAAGLAAAWCEARERKPLHAPVRGEWRKTARLRFEALPRDLFPNVVASAPELAACFEQMPFEEGLDRLLDSLASEIG